MPRISDKRERLVSAAKDLIHRQGFNRTTLADIARESDVPLGNVYYYFKTKEDICNAVIEERRENIRESLQECRCKENDPKKNLIMAVKMIMKQSDSVAEYGCPVGSLCQELDKTPSPLSDAASRTARRTARCDPGKPSLGSLTSCSSGNRFMPIQRKM